MNHHSPQGTEDIESHRFDWAVKLLSEALDLSN